MVFKIADFERELKKDNSHFERIKKSRIHDLVALLRRKTPPVMPPQILASMQKVDSKAWTKYVNVKRYLLAQFPTIASQLSAPTATATATAPGYKAGKWTRTKDEDGRWHEYVLQARGESCGPACVLMLKVAAHPAQRHRLSEAEMRGVVALYEKNKQHTGVSSIGPEAMSAHDWRQLGSDARHLIDALKAQPASVAGARTLYGQPSEVRRQLNQCTPNSPAILGWWWLPDRNAGHWTVCAGPTKDGSKLIVLDPYYGTQHLDNTDAGFCDYHVMEGGKEVSHGVFDPNDANDIAVIMSKPA